MTFADGVAAVAIALSLFAILLGVLFYKWQSDLARVMQSLLAEIRGRTTRTEEELQTVVKLAVQAVEQERASTGEKFADTAGRVEALEKQLARFEGKLSTAGDKEYKKLMDQLRQETSRLASDVAELKQKRPIGVYKGAARDTVAGLLAVAEHPRIGPLLQELVAGAGDAPFMAFKYGDAFEAARRAGLIELDFGGDRPSGSVRLTDAGRALARANPQKANGGAR